MQDHRAPRYCARIIACAALAVAAGCSSAARPAADAAPIDATPVDARDRDATPADAAPADASLYRTQADRAMAALEAMYLKGLALFGTGWWTSANALEATIDYSRLTGNQAYLQLVTRTFDVHAQNSPLNKAPNFINEYYDDEGWWALTWVKAYDLTGETRYLEMARTIFDDMTGGWDDVCGGGLWWRKQRDYKNAITNELFLTLAARLHQRTVTGGATSAYLVWAERAWRWFAGSGMINGENLVNDGLDAACRNNGQTTWTYNQGVILGGLIELYRVTGDEALRRQALAIADAATTELVTARGVLTESCEPTCDDNGSQFKGIFMRYLGQLHEAAPTPRHAAFIARNADSIRERAMNDSGSIGLLWDAAFDRADPCRQSSGLDAINAALAVEAAGQKAP